MVPNYINTVFVERPSNIYFTLIFTKRNRNNFPSVGCTEQKEFNIELMFLIFHFPSSHFERLFFI